MNKKLVSTPDEFEIVEVYRFEGETNPSDEAAGVIAREIKVKSMKGVLVNATVYMLIRYRML